VRFVGVDAGVLPSSSSARQVDDVLRAQFAPGLDAPLHLAVRSPAVVRKIERLPHVLGVTRPERVGAQLWSVDVIPDAPAMSNQTKALVRVLRVFLGVS